MDIAKSIKDLRESTGLSRKEFSEYTGIPVRTLEDWEAGRRTPPEYIPRLLADQIIRIALQEKCQSNIRITGDLSYVFLSACDSRRLINERDYIEVYFVE